jgi:predicted CoA-binding protein
MPLVSKKTIDAFYANKRIAVVGASRNKSKYGHALLEQLLRSGYDAVPVNPHAEEIAGRKCFKSVRDVSPGVSVAIAVVPPLEQERVVSECAEAGVKTVWLHEHVMKGVSNPDALVLCRQKGLEVITGYCPMMFMPGTAFLHRAHGFVMKVFGAYPK